MKLTWNDVFDSRKIWPGDWYYCCNIAKTYDYKYIAFNGYVFKLGQPLDYNMAVCTIEDLE